MRSSGQSRLSSPITGNFASHATLIGLPTAAHLVKRADTVSGDPTLYDLTIACPTPTMMKCVGFC